MKIGLYTVDLPANWGGAFVLREDINRAAANVKGRHQFEPVSIPPDKPKGRLRAKWDWHFSKPTSIATYHQRFADEVVRRHFDMLWFNNFDPIYIGKPFILNIFDLQHRLQPYFPEVSNNGQFEIREASYADAARRAAIVTVGSQEAKEQVCHFYGVSPENVLVLPFPTPQRAIDIATGTLAVSPTQDIRSKYGIKNDFLFYPAQFWSHKNHVNLLRALELLRDERGRTISLVCTGSDHGNRPHVEAVARELGLIDLVHFCGFVPYEDVLAFYREARALAYVSFFGPENLPPLEAMALGCPVILSDIPGVRALYGECPILVQPDNPRSIAEGVEFVLDNTDQVRTRLKKGREMALQNSADHYLERLQIALDGFERKRRCWP